MALLAGLTACGAPLLPQYAPKVSVNAAEVAGDGPSGAGGSEPGLRSGQGSWVGGEDGRERIVVVFDRQIDATTVDASAFAVVFADGSRARVNTAHFGAGDEGEENRSVVLEGDFGRRSDDPAGEDVDDWRVEQVQVFGYVFAEDGASMRGTDVLVHAPGAPVLAGARWFEPGSECPEGQVGLRTWWSIEVSGDATAVSAGTRLVSEAGPSSTPSLVLDLESGPAGPDNVLEYCFDRPVRPATLELKPDLLRSVDGPANAPVAADLRALSLPPERRP